MIFVFVLLFSVNAYALVCAPDEIYIRQQNITAYTKSDGTFVKAHIRHSHCRRIQKLNYFNDSTNQKIKGIKTSIKKWKEEKKEEGILPKTYFYQTLTIHQVKTLQTT